MLDCVPVLLLKSNYLLNLFPYASLCLKSVFGVVCVGSGFAIYDAY